MRADGPLAGRTVVVTRPQAQAAPLAEAIAAGHYDFVNEKVTAENFPPETTGVKEVKAKLLCFNRSFVNGDEALAEIEKLGYRPGNVRELLTLDATHPGLTRIAFPVAALGSSLNSFGGPCFVCFIKFYPRTEKGESRLGLASSTVS